VAESSAYEYQEILILCAVLLGSSFRARGEALRVFIRGGKKTHGPHIETSLMNGYVRRVWKRI